MNYALIFAGGIGSRMNSRTKPKQFLEIHGKPILIHTLENFSQHRLIDAICVVVVKDWLDYTEQQISRFGISKVNWIIPGGKTAMDTQLIGLRQIVKSKTNNEEDIVLIHDGVRPLITEDVITNCIASVKRYGSGITIAPADETIVCTNSVGQISKTIQRSECRLARAPQAFKLNEILECHERAMKDGKSFVDSASLMIDYGFTLHIVEGPTENIKVTNPADFYICRALLDAR